MYQKFEEVELILKDILITPTSPFRENLVLKKILDYVHKYKLKVTVTKYNNIIATLDGEKSFGELYLISHTDHPGFLLEKASKNKALLKTMGGVNIDAWNFKEVAEYDVLTGEKYIYKVMRTVNREDSKFVEVELGDKRPNEINVFTLNLKSYQERGSKIYAHRIDDLGGCAALLCALNYLFIHNLKPKVTVNFVFTRAEEVGFIGLISLIKNGYLPKNGYYLSCETSKCIPPVEFGKGVVLRIGDRGGIFNNEFTSALLAYFNKKGLTNKLQLQRALLDGGTCEATALLVNNFTVSGLACPLGNYHNNANQNTLAEEFIDKNDFLSFANTLIEIILNFREILDSYNKKEIKERIFTNFKRMEKYL
jgi:putative aminopeptidase FrvX